MDMGSQHQRVDTDFGGMHPEACQIDDRASDAVAEGFAR